MSSDQHSAERTGSGPEQKVSGPDDWFLTTAERGNPFTRLDYRRGDADERLGEGPLTISELMAQAARRG